MSRPNYSLYTTHLLTGFAKRTLKYLASFRINIQVVIIETYWKNGMKYVTKIMPCKLYACVIICASFLVFPCVLQPNYSLYTTHLLTGFVKRTLQYSASFRINIQVVIIETYWKNGMEYVTSGIYVCAKFGGSLYDAVGGVVFVRTGRLGWR